MPSDPIPDAVGLRFAACSYAVQLHNTGFREVAQMLADCLLGADTADPDAIRRTAELGLSRRGPGYFGIGDRQPARGDVLISDRLLDQLTYLCKALKTDDPVFHRKVAESQVQLRTSIVYSTPATGAIVVSPEAEPGQLEMRISRSLGGLAIVTDVSPPAEG